MLSRDRLRYFTAFLILAVCLIAVISNAVSVYSQYEASRERYRNYQQNSEKDRQKATEEIASDCVVIPHVNPALRDCLREKISAYEKKEDTNRDLQAQQEMAFWAMWTTIVGYGALIVSVGGVFLLILSLRQTRQAIINTREIGEAQVRAYLSVDLPETYERSKLTEIGPGKTPTITLKISNSGQSPAHDMKYIAALMVKEFPLPAQQGDLLEPDPESIQQGAAIAAQGHIRADAKLNEPFTEDQVKSIMNDGKDRLFAVCIVTYFDVFKRVRRKTKFCAYLTQNGHVSIAPNGNRIVGYEWALANVHNEAT